jgi:hypothetical protein
MEREGVPFPANYIVISCPTSRNADFPPLLSKQYVVGGSCKSSPVKDSDVFAYKTRINVEINP